MLNNDFVKRNIFIRIPSKTMEKFKCHHDFLVRYMDMDKIDLKQMHEFLISMKNLYKMELPGYEKFQEVWAYLLNTYSELTDRWTRPDGFEDFIINGDYYITREYFDEDSRRNFHQLFDDKVVSENDQEKISRLSDNDIEDYTIMNEVSFKRTYLDLFPELLLLLSDFYNDKNDERCQCSDVLILG